MQVLNWVGVRIDIPPHISDERSWLAGWHEAAVSSFLWEAVRFRSLRALNEAQALNATIGRYVEIQVQYRGEFTTYTFDQFESMAKEGS